MARKEPFKVEVEGVARLKRALEAAGTDLADLKEAYSEAAKIVEDTAAAQTPRDSGALLASLRSSGDKKGGVIRAGSRVVPYAGPIHYGWPARGIKGNAFILNAARSEEPAWLQVFERKIDDVIDRVTDA